MLVNITYPGILGDNAPKANEGKFKDWGYEGQINYNGKVNDFTYHVGGTFTFARNELTDFGGVTVLSSGYKSTMQGYPLKSIFGLRYAGKIQNEEQLKVYLAKYYDNNGIGIPSNLRVGDNMYCDETMMENWMRRIISFWVATLLKYPTHSISGQVGKVWT